MKIAIFAVALLLTGCQTQTDKKLDSIIERLDGLEAKLNDHVEQTSSDVDELKTEIQNIDCGT